MELDLNQTKNNFKDYKHALSIPILEPKLYSKPKVTIAIPTYKRSKLLKEAIDSALKQLNYDDYEVLVVDNNPERSCDTERLLLTYKSKKIRYYKNTSNIGMFGNWNRCVELSLGEYVTILNDDDLLHENYLHYVMNSALKTNKLIYVGAYKINCYPFNFIGRQKGIKAMLKQNIDLSDFVVGNQSYGSLGIMYKTVNIINLGGFDKDFFPSADYVFNSRYVHRYGGLKILRKLSYYRIMENESVKESNLEIWPKLDNLIKTEIAKHAYPKKHIKGLLTYAAIHQKKYLNSQWGANTTFSEEQQKFLKTSYKVYELKLKLKLLWKVIKGTFHGTS